MNSNLVDKNVVTCFLESGGEILILRRSENVGSYQGRWAGVSGYIESNPDMQALVEIEEETGLTGEDIRLINKSEPLYIEDEEMGIRWVVHPLLFSVKDRTKIKTDWEHKETRWIKPGDIDDYRTVPNLKEALQMVYKA